MIGCYAAFSLECTATVHAERVIGDGGEQQATTKCTGRVITTSCAMTTPNKSVAFFYPYCRRINRHINAIAHLCLRGDRW